LDFHTVLAVDPFAYFKTLIFFTNVNLLYIFLTWFRTRTRVRLVALVICEYIVMIVEG